MIKTPHRTTDRSFTRSVIKALWILKQLPKMNRNHTDKLPALILRALNSIANVNAHSSARGAQVPPILLVIRKLFHVFQIKGQHATIPINSCGIAIVPVLLLYMGLSVVTRFSLLSYIETIINIKLLFDQQPSASK